jgi:hypothetical protein
MFWFSSRIMPVVVLSGLVAVCEGAVNLHTAGSPASVSVLTNQQATISYTISNLGSDAASNAGINISVPASFTNVTGMAVSQGSVSFDSGVVMGDFGTINASAQVTISFTATCPQNGNFNVTGTAYSSVTDSDPTDNSGTVAVTVASTLTHDLVLSAIADNPDPVAANGFVHYTFQLTNSGGQTAQNTTLQVSISSGQITAANVTGSLDVNSSHDAATVSVGTLGPNGDFGTYDFTVTAPASGSITFSASAACSNAETNNANNSGSQTTTVTGGPVGGAADVSVRWLDDVGKAPHQECKDLEIPVCKTKGTLLVTNSGNGASDKTSSVSFILSTDLVVDSNDIYFPVAKLGSVKPGKTKSVKLNKSTLGSFSGYWLIGVANVPGDANTANNSIAIKLP